MAFISTSKYIQFFSIESKTQEEFLIIAIEAAKLLEWKIRNISETGFIVYTSFSLNAWSEAFKLKIKDGIVTFNNEQTKQQMADPWQNKVNINNFISTYNKLKNTFTAKELEIMYEEQYKT